MSEENEEKKTAKPLRANENIPEAFQAARIKLGRARPYIQRALWSVPVFITDTAVDPGGAPTIGVDKWWRMYVNPAYLDKVDVDQLATTLYHEVAGHLLSNHADRAEAYNVGLNHAIWNLAADMAINAAIMREANEVPQLAGAALKLNFPAGYGILPKDSVKFGAPAPFPDDWTAEAYYDELLKYAQKVTVKGKGKKKGDGDDDPHAGCGSGADAHKRDYEIDGGGSKEGKDKDNRGLSPAEQELVRQAVAQEVVEYAKQKGRGTVPAGLLVWAEERFDPKVPWERVTRTLIRRCLGAEVLGHQVPSYKRPSRRSAAVMGRVLLPTRWKPIPEIAVIVDTSGSMGCDMRLGKALTELDSLLGSMHAKVHFGACDAAATQLKRIKGQHLAPSLLVGGGGTDMRVGIDSMLAMRPLPHLMVVISDGETPWPAEETPIPLVIVLVGDKSAESGVPAWAHTVFVDAKEAK